MIKCLCFAAAFVALSAASAAAQVNPDFIPPPAGPKTVAACTPSFRAGRIESECGHLSVAAMRDAFSDPALKDCGKLEVQIRKVCTSSTDRPKPEVPVYRRSEPEAVPAPGAQPAPQAAAEPDDQDAPDAQAEAKMAAYPPPPPPAFRPPPPRRMPPAAYHPGPRPVPGGVLNPRAFTGAIQQVLRGGQGYGNRRYYKRRVIRRSYGAGYAAAPSHTVGRSAPYCPDPNTQMEKFIEVNGAQPREGCVIGKIPGKPCLGWVCRRAAAAPPVLYRKY